MWIINDPELKAKVNTFFSDEEITNAFVKNADCYKYFRLSTNINKSSFTFLIDKDLMKFIPEYNPNGWNQYPEVNPPKSGYYLVYLSKSNNIRIQVDKFVKEEFNDFWKNNFKCEVLAFRPLNVAPPAPEELNE